MKFSEGGRSISDKLNTCGPSIYEMYIEDLEREWREKTLIKVNDINSDIDYIKRCIEISQNARNHQNHPFGALLVDSHGDIILEQENIEVTENLCTGHAESTLAAKASKLFNKDFLWDCTLYTTVEPCVMCTGAIYWSNIGQIVYGLSETKLLKLTGNDSRNLTFDLSCRNVIRCGQKDITVHGPILEVEEEVMKVHRGYWL